MSESLMLNLFLAAWAFVLSFAGVSWWQRSRRSEEDADVNQFGP